MSSRPMSGTPFAILSIVLFLIGIGGFGTASAGDVDMFGLTIEAKYACFVYFVLGGLCVWSTLEARRRGSSLVTRRKEGRGLEVR